MVLIGFDRKHVLEPKHQLAGINRLGEKVGSTEPQCLKLDLRIICCGQHDRGNHHQVVIAAHACQNLKPRDFRHFDVQEHNVGLVLADHVDRVRRLCRRDEVIKAFLLQVRFDDFNVDTLVVNDHDFRVTGAGQCSSPRTRDLDDSMVASTL